MRRHERFRSGVAARRLDVQQSILFECLLATTCIDGSADAPASFMSRIPGVATYDIRRPGGGAQRLAGAAPLSGYAHPPYVAWYRERRKRIAARARHINSHVVFSVTEHSLRRMP